MKSKEILFGKKMMVALKKTVFDMVTLYFSSTVVVVVVVTTVSVTTFGSF